MIAFAIKRKREIISKNRLIVKGNNSCVLLRDVIGSSETALSDTHLVKMKIIKLQTLMIEDGWISREMFSQ